MTRPQGQTTKEDETPSKFVKEDNKTEDHKYFSYFYYQLETKDDKPLTGGGYSVKEHIFVNGDPAGVKTSEKDFVSIANGEARDRVGKERKPRKDDNEDVIRYQTFTVRYEGKEYNLTSNFKQETRVVNGHVTNTVTVIRP